MIETLGTWLTAERQGRGVRRNQDGCAEHQPVTSIANTLRDVYAWQSAGDDVWTALGWCIGPRVVAYALGMRPYHRRRAVVASPRAARGR
jgi:hypothetical protein